MRYIKHSTLHLILLCMIICSCSEVDYSNIVPQNSTSVSCIDLNDMPASQSLLRSLLHTDKLASLGIATQQPAYMFTTPEGYLGICTPLTGSDILSQHLSEYVDKGMSTEMREYHDVMFTIIQNSWLVGFNDKAMLVLGHINAASATAARQYAVRLFQQDESNSFNASPLARRLQSLQGRNRMIANVGSMPEQMKALIMLGAPEGTDESDVYQAAALTMHNGTLEMKSQPFALNPDIDKTLHAALDKLHPITSKYISDSSTIAAAIYLNANGSVLLPMVKADKPLALILSQTDDEHSASETLAAANGDIALHVIMHSDGSTATTIQVSNEKDADIKTSSRNTKDTTTDKHHLAGNKIAAQINIKALPNDAKLLVQTFIMPRFGQVDTIIYTVSNE